MRENGPGEAEPTGAPAQRPPSMLVAEDDPHQIRRVAGADLLHDAGPVDLHRAWRDAENPPGLLVREAFGDLIQHLGLACGQGFRVREAPGAGVLPALVPVAIGPNRLADAL